MVTGPMLGRIRCHCTICQSVNQAAYADSTIFQAKHVPLDRVEHVRFETLKKPPALQRGFCGSCGCFVMAYTTVLPFYSLVFVPVARYPATVQLPEPAMHVFYESRVADVADDLPKYSGALSSRLAVIRMLLRARFGRTGRA
ncbi:MAG: GFA family protein [Xanthomonadales bacterium]|nr:GFA family protein [Xanthomonadales bacterium]